MKHSFSVILTVCVLMVIGAALVSRLDISNSPRPRQGKTLTISYRWPGASAKVIEQNVTSRIEGLVSSVNGVESVSSVSNFGNGSVTLQLKKQASVSSVKFEVASLLRQVRDRLPKDVSYPELSGGEVVTGKETDRNTHILTYVVNANGTDGDIRKRTEKTLKPLVERVKGVSHVDVSGGSDRYLEIAYDAEQLSLYGLTSADVVEAIRNFLGREDIVGTPLVPDKNAGGADSKSHNLVRIPLFLTIPHSGSQGEGVHSLESIPLKSIDGKIVYLNHLAKCEFKDKDPAGYYRVNGRNTVYVNIHSEKDANLASVSSKVKAVVSDFEDNQQTLQPDRRLNLNLSYDRAEEQLSEFRTLIVRSGMSLVILLVFVFLCKRSLKYLAIIFTTLLANILLAVICYWLFDIRLHPFSMAGITVSLGLIIDSTIVMIDHYSYHRNYTAFFGILGAMLTTIGSLIIIFWLPDFLKNDLYDFSWTVIINLSVALFVSAFFAPALVSKLNYTSRTKGRQPTRRLAVWWNRIYNRYLHLACHRFGRWAIISLFAVVFGFSLYCFIQALEKNFYRYEREELKLTIRAQMPLGGTARQLNEKVESVEAFLSQFREIKRFETNVGWWGATIVVEFTPEALKTSFPYILETKTIGKVITIGGADWSTSGVSERGFSNSINLQYRSNRIELVGYDYDRLYRYAEDMCKTLAQNNRVSDITIETPGHEHQNDELFMEYDRRMLSADSVRVQDIHSALSTLLAEHPMGRAKGDHQRTDIVLRPLQHEGFDLWQLENSYIRLADRQIRLSDFMEINRREAKNCIPREKQEYVLRVAFNVIGSYTYSCRYIKRITEAYNARFPVGFRCMDPRFGYFQQGNTQYWLIGLVVLIIFFVCTILFESFYKSVVIILLIPASMIGTFLTFYFSGIEFGTGGFASMVLLCGLTVNAGIYLMNELNDQHRCACLIGDRHATVKRPVLTSPRIFLKAYNHKVIPVFLTVLSTVLGLIPFLIDGADQRFWYSFAVGSISGLLFSLFALVLFLPCLCVRRKRRC